jgi:outer membrane receptor for ferric coprogen and ferric-rhodotorulic acid
VREVVIDRDEKSNISNSGKDWYPKGFAIFHMFESKVVGGVLLYNGIMYDEQRGESDYVSAIDLYQPPSKWLDENSIVHSITGNVLCRCAE